MPIVSEMNAKQLKKVYREHMLDDFPLYELRPYNSMHRLMHKGRYRAYAYIDGTDLLAYACCFISSDGEYALLDYFAVVPEFRGRGVGGSFISDLAGADVAGNGLFIECDRVQAAATKEEQETRKRRIRFYLNNGCLGIGISIRFFTVKFDILFMPLNGRDIENSVLYNKLDVFYREIYGIAYRIFCKLAKTE